MTVEEARAGVGRRVIYQPPGRGVEPQETGTITEVRAVWREGYPSEEQGYVMVRYTGDTLSKATAPELLTFVEEAR